MLVCPDLVVAGTEFGWPPGTDKTKIKCTWYYGPETGTGPRCQPSKSKLGADTLDAKAQCHNIPTVRVESLPSAAA